MRFCVEPRHIIGRHPFGVSNLQCGFRFYCDNAISERRLSSYVHLYSRRSYYTYRFWFLYSSAIYTRVRSKSVEWLWTLRFCATGNPIRVWLSSRQCSKTTRKYTILRNIQYIIYLKYMLDKHHFPN